MKIQLLIIATCIFHLSLSQTDGNPHKWDRQRRCDTDGYNPPCGLCEGIGGIPTSDKNSDIKLTKCTPIAEASQVDNSTGQVKFPYLPKQFTNAGFYEVLITKKTNIFCIGGFPGDTSVGDNCYGAQEGTFHYDWNPQHPNLKIDYNVAGKLFNTTTIVSHRDGTMWIDNQSIKQCICADPGSSFGITIYPVQWNFMEQDSHYLGREKLWIEYLWKEMVVDHWTKGPHHIWMDVEGGQIVRMWQPWNGLEIFDPAKWVYSVDPAVMQFPAPNCKKGGAWFRIKCDDDGNYNGGKKESEQFLE